MHQHHASEILLTLSSNRRAFGTSNDQINNEIFISGRVIEIPLRRQIQLRCCHVNYDNNSGQDNQHGQTNFLHSLLPWMFFEVFQNQNRNQKSSYSSPEMTGNAILKMVNILAVPLHTTGQLVASST